MCVQHLNNVIGASNSGHSVAAIHQRPRPWEKTEEYQSGEFQLGPFQEEPLERTNCLMIAMFDCDLS